MNINLLNKKIEDFSADKNKISKKDLISFYWSKKDPNVQLNIINHFINENDIIFDPFLGSGSILFSLDACKKNIKFIGNEINEMPLAFINFNLKNLTSSELIDMRKRFNLFYQEFKKFYEYQNIFFNEKIQLSKLIFNYKNNKEIEIESFYLNNGVKSFVIKSKKNKIFKQNQKIYLDRFYNCQNKIKKRDIILLKNSRIAIKDNMKLSSIFNPINFFVLLEFSKKFKNDINMITILSSVLHLCRLTDIKSQSQFPYWVPNKKVIERNILSLIFKKIEEVITYKNQNTLNLKLKKNFKFLDNKGKNILLFNKPIQKITEKNIPNNCVDIVITDPPYFDQVPYSEYLKIWEFFCNFRSNIEDEIIYSNREYKRKKLNDYLNDLKNAFILINKKLKMNGYALVFFKDSKPKNIHFFLNIMKISGFKYLRSLHINKKKYTYKQNTTPLTTVSGDCLFFFKKVGISNGKLNLKLTNNKENSLDTIKKETKKFVKSYIKKNNTPSLGELYDNGLIKILFEKNLLYQIKNSKLIVDILKEEFDFLRIKKYEKK